MLMGWIWSIIIVISLYSAFIFDNASELAAAIPLGAQAGFTLAISIGGSLCLWTGVGRLLEKTGVTKLLSKLLQPVLYRLFPTTKTNSALKCALSGNICANFLGLGNAATPLGIQAAKEMLRPEKPGVATDELCRLIVLNTASIQLIPSNVAAVRASAGSASPFDILPAVWVTSLCSAGLGVFFAWIFGKVWHHD